MGAPLPVGIMTSPPVPVPVPAPVPDFGLTRIGNGNGNGNGNGLPNQHTSDSPRDNRLVDEGDPR